LSGLAGEKKRWDEDSKNFSARKKKLVADVAGVCAFVTYVGPSTLNSVKSYIRALVSIRKNVGCLRTPRL